MNSIIRAVERKQLTDRALDYAPGDTINVSFKIREGDKERIQQFQGTVIQKSGTGLGETLTVRKSGANGIYVERIFPAHSPLIAEITILKRGKVRRAKLFYLRELTGKATRIKEKKAKVSQ